LRDRRLATNLGRQAALTIDRNFHISHTYDRYLALYKRALGNLSR
jgi:hypothetical protein